MNAIGFEQHDHQSCRASAMREVEALCDEKGLRLTPVRRRVLEILLDRHAALGAYQILDVLKQEGLGSQPPVVYRALDFLSEHGFVHKIERLNAFVACSHIADGHSPMFLICSSCQLVAEAPSHIEAGRLGAAADQVGFQITRTVVEAEGLCPSCQDVTA